MKANKTNNEKHSSLNGLDKKEHDSSSNSLETSTNKNNSQDNDNSEHPHNMRETVSDTDISEQSEKYFDAKEKVLSKENLSFEGSDSDNETIDEGESPDKNDSSMRSSFCNGMNGFTPRESTASPTGVTPLVAVIKPKDMHDVHLDIHDDDEDDDDYSDVSTAWATSFWTQFSVLTERTFKQSKPEILSKISFFQVRKLSSELLLLFYQKKKFSFNFFYFEKLYLRINLGFSTDITTGTT